MDVVSISGTVGTYFVTNEIGNLYKWNVDNMVKFKADKEDNIQQRYVDSSRGSVFRVRSMINPEFCKIKRISTDLRTY